MDYLKIINTNVKSGFIALKLQKSNGLWEIDTNQEFIDEHIFSTLDYLYEHYYPDYDERVCAIYNCDDKFEYGHVKFPLPCEISSMKKENVECSPIAIFAIICIDNAYNYDNGEGYCIYAVYKCDIKHELKIY